MRKRGDRIRKRGVKGIFFDAGDTLFEAKEPIGLSYSRIAAEYGLSCEAAFLNARFRAAFKTSPPLAFGAVSEAAGLRLERQWWEQVVRSVFAGFDFPEFDAFFEALYRYFGRGEAWRLFPETKAVLSELKSEGYRLGVISNFDSRLPAICASLGIGEDFEAILFSSREGMAKPAAEIFERALARIGLAPGEAVHVGDHPENDVKGAQAVGMKAIWVDRSPGRSDDASGFRRDDLRIDSLRIDTLRSIAGVLKAAADR